MSTLVFEVPLYHGIDTRKWMYVFGGLLCACNISRNQFGVIAIELGTVSETLPEVIQSIFNDSVGPETILSNYNLTSKRPFPYLIEQRSQKSQ